MKRLLILIALITGILPSSGQEAQDSVRLDEVVIKGSSRKAARMRTPLNVTQVNAGFIRENLSGSLMQTLESIPGVNAMTIGSGQSKAAIRGLGFNRLIVAENGIKHEGQQWGEDHGLEVNQFAIDAVDVIKGPSSLLYGSDAIGGVINLRSNTLPVERIEGEISMSGRSNNESIGISAGIRGRESRLFYRADLTWIDYADYKVPADSIQYYSYYFRLKDRRLRNTAGKERNGSLTLGWTGDRFRTAFTASNVYSGNGFFANAHGLEIRLSDIDYDRSSRDIDLPRHTVNHLKIANLTTWHIGNSRLEGRFAYQNNLRKEFAEAVSHGYMPVPPDSLERKYNKHTFSGALDFHFSPAKRHETTAGVSGEHQRNKRAGWGFIIPDFNLYTYGVYLYDRFHASDKLVLSAGIRFDRTGINTESYHDWYMTPDENGDYQYMERSRALSRTFNSLTWSAGINYNKNEWSLKANIGKSYRAPIAKELSSDGINYHIFRYEKGNEALDAEESYQLDAGIGWNKGRWEVLVEPFLNYFPNYIYLNPASGYKEGLQMYHYTQNKVLRYGFEALAGYKLTKELEASVTGEYLYAAQRSGSKKGYGLPFSPPWRSVLTLNYSPLRKWSGKNAYIKLEYVITGEQKRIVPPEKTTAGFQLLNLALGREFAFGKQSIRVGIRAENLLDKKYYDHTGYYRLIDVPEPGRNFTGMVSMNF